MEKAIIAQKKEDVASLTKRMKESKTVIAFDYIGLTVEEMTALRGQLRAAGCEVKVYKNNISRRAAIEAGYEGFNDCFVGPKAIAFGKADAVAPAKVVFEFAKKAKKVKIQAGVVEGKVVNEAQITRLATLPSYEGILTMLASSMLQPLKNLSIALNLYATEQKA